ncbi:serine hydrolase [Nonomuraea sp. NPDC050556]|uniref:serine hydrolase n=1 Tax=Nonomuraea sp. NPDC050556 TaxID=3364369 RepID=UPI0037A7F8D7
MRVLAAALAAATVAVAACAGVQTPTPAAASAVQESAVERQLTWLMDAVGRAPLPDSELTAHFAESFLRQVPPAQINEVLKTWKDLRLDKVLFVRGTSLVAEMTLNGKKQNLELTVDGSGLISGARMDDPPVERTPPTSWKELDKRMRAVAPQVGFLAAEITKGGACRPVHGIQPRTPRALGSMFKLYVLGAAAEHIKDWKTELTIRPELKSLPSGELQNRPDNSKVTVEEAAKLMISISDNTAADLLLNKVGRKAVEAKNRQWSSTRNEPFLSTRDMFVIKGTKRVDAYLNAPDRRAFLRDVVAKVPLSDITTWEKPTAIDTVEWFGSPKDVCRAHASLRGLADERVNQAMSTNTLAAKELTDVWYKGGSEPGVLALGFSAKSGGRTYSVTLMASDPAAPIDENQAGSELIALAQGAFTLATRR